MPGVGFPRPPTSKRPVNAAAQLTLRHATNSGLQASSMRTVPSMVLVREMIRLAIEAESEPACVAACQKILDRPTARQPIQGTVDHGISERLAEL